jgi:hypothetical protein
MAMQREDDMRNIVPVKLEDGRIREGHYGSTSAEGMMGAFFVMGPNGKDLKIVSSGVDTDHGWEHVSVSCNNRTPNWAEMCFVKDLFWRDDECAVQYHPPKSEYVNHHPYCLHLWRPLDGTLPIPMPPSMLVGPKP